MTSYDIFALTILAFVFCIGAIFGSFLNVVILRAFSGESIVLPPSKCPKCGNRLKWWHNIPILSYILLRGKCHFCHEKISIQYPIIEFITGVLFLLTFFRYGLQIDVIFAFAVVCMLVVLSVTDIKERVVFDKHTYTLIAIGLGYNLIITAMQVWDQINTITGFHISTEWCLNNPMTISILGMLLGALVMEIAARIGYIIAGGRAFGEGDTYIAAGLGAVFGWQNIILILILSLFLQLIFTLPLFIKNQIKLKNYVNVTALVLFLVYAAGFYYAEHKTAIFDNDLFMLGALAGLVILGIAACILILKGLKKQEELTFLPFGPALALAGLIVLLTNISLPF